MVSPKFVPEIRGNILLRARKHSLIISAFILGTGLGLFLGRVLFWSDSGDTFLNTLPHAEEKKEQNLVPNVRQAMPTKGRTLTRDEHGTDTVRNNPSILNGIAVAETPEVVPLKGMVVALSMGSSMVAQTRTVQGGRFTIASLKLGTGTIFLLAPGSRKRLAAEEVTMEEGGIANIRLAVRLRTKTTISGRVLSSEGEPIPSAEVVLERTEGETAYSCRTDGDGKFTIPGIMVLARDLAQEEVIRQLLNPETIRAVCLEGRASHPDYQTGLFRIRFTHPLLLPKTIQKEIQLHVGGFVSGTVRTRDGGLLDNRWTENAFLAWALHSDQGGTSCNTQVRNGRFRFEIHEKGFLTIGGKSGRVNYRRKRMGEVSPDTRLTDVEIVADILPEHRIQLLDDAGLSLSGISERFSVYLSASAVTQESRDGDAFVESGEVVVITDSLEPTCVHVQGAGFAPATIGLSPGNMPDTLTLKRVPPLVRGHFILPPGTTADKIYAVMTTSGSGMSSSGKLHFDELDPMTGSFAVARPVNFHPDRIYSLHFSLPGYKTCRLSQIQVKSGMTLENVKIQFAD